MEREIHQKILQCHSTAIAECGMLEQIEECSDRPRILQWRRQWEVGVPG